MKEALKMSALHLVEFLEENFEGYHSGEQKNGN